MYYIWVMLTFRIKTLGKTQVCSQSEQRSAALGSCQWLVTLAIWNYMKWSALLTLKSSHMYHIKTLHHHHHCGLNQDVVLLCPSGHLPGCFLSSTFIVNTYYKRNARRSSTYNAIIAITTFVFDTSNNAYQFTIQNHKKKEKNILRMNCFSTSLPKPFGMEKNSKMILNNNSPKMDYRHHSKSKAIWYALYRQLLYRLYCSGFRHHWVMLSKCLRQRKL